MGLSSTDNWLTARLGLSLLPGSSSEAQATSGKPLQYDLKKKKTISISFFVSRVQFNEQEQEEMILLPWTSDISYLRTIFTGKAMGTMIYLNWFSFLQGQIHFLEETSCHIPYEVLAHGFDKMTAS